jgi:hypothetical protein
MSFAGNLFDKFFPSPTAGASLGASDKRKKSGPPNDEPGRHSDEDIYGGSSPNLLPLGSIRNTAGYVSGPSSPIDFRSDALELEMSVQEELETEHQQELLDEYENGDEIMDDKPEEVINEEEGFRSSPPSSSPMRERSPRRPLGELTMEDIVPMETTASRTTAQDMNIVKDQLPKKAWRELSNDEAWNRSPNRRALELIREAQRLRLDAASMIQESIGEPEYALRDVEVRDGLWQIMNQMEEFSKAHFTFDVPEDAHHIALTETFRSMSKETVKVIGCVASGGPEGEQGWRSLFYDQEKRQALVCAIIGNVISEQVLQHIFFGGEPGQVRAVARLQSEYQNEDGKSLEPIHSCTI